MAGSVPVVSTDGTVPARHIAALFDFILAISLSVAAAKACSDDLLALQAPVCFAAFLGYYFLFEGFFCRTFGKLLTGLAVVGADGRPCTWRQSLIRTLFRILEVNPLLFGGLPAAASIVCTKDHQRFGDKWANTIVVPTARLAIFRKKNSTA